jgi:hypothetical protein
MGAEAAEDDDEPFEEKMKRLTPKLLEIFHKVFAPLVKTLECMPRK